MQLRCERQFHFSFLGERQFNFLFFLGEHEFWKKINSMWFLSLQKYLRPCRLHAPCRSGHISGGCRLGCTLGLRKRQQICHSSGGSSIGSCGIGCCGGGGSVGAAAASCTLTVGAAGHGLVGAGGVLRLRPHGLHYALAARASPSRLALRPCGSLYTIAAWGRRRRWWQRQWKQRRQMLALAACATCLQARSWLGFARFTFAARATRSRLKHNNQTQSSGRKSCFGSAATYLLQR
jgi:hypothetical protein